MLIRKESLNKENNDNAVIQKTRKMKDRQKRS